MAKHHREVKAAQNKDQSRYEHSEVFDDNLLPEASEIEKLHSIDTNILDWLKGRAEKEQDFRHSAFNRRLTLVDNHDKRGHYTSRFALVVYFILVAGCVAASYFLLRDGKNLQGSIFGTAAVILALAVLITRRQPKPPFKEEVK